VEGGGVGGTVPPPSPAGPDCVGRSRRGGQPGRGGGTAVACVECMHACELHHHEGRQASHGRRQREGGCLTPRPGRPAAGRLPAFGAPLLRRMRARHQGAASAAASLTEATAANRRQDLSGPPVSVCHPQPRGRRRPGHAAAAAAAAPEAAGLRERGLPLRGAQPVGRGPWAFGGLTQRGRGDRQFSNLAKSKPWPSPAQPASARAALTLPASSTPWASPTLGTRC
jgi:hypothetical protein